MPHVCKFAHGASEYLSKLPAHHFNGTLDVSKCSRKAQNCLAPFSEPALRAHFSFLALCRASSQPLSVTQGLYRINVGALDVVT